MVWKHQKQFFVLIWTQTRLLMWFGSFRSDCMKKYQILKIWLILADFYKKVWGPKFRMPERALKLNFYPKKRWNLMIWYVNSPFWYRNDILEPFIFESNRPERLKIFDLEPMCIGTKGRFLVRLGSSFISRI